MNAADRPPGKTNPYGWPLPATDRLLLEEGIYAALPTPAEDIAARLVTLVHCCFNPAVWANSPANRAAYWPGLTERVLAAAIKSETVAGWWEIVITEVVGLPLRAILLLHEKNLLVHPAALPGTQVPDADVLNVLREYPRDLVDRTRATAAVRRDARSKPAPGEDYAELSEPREGDHQ